MTTTPDPREHTSDVHSETRATVNAELRVAPDTFEITWQNGHTEFIQAHQVSWPGNSIFAPVPGPRRVQFHAEIDGRWTLQLSALEADIRTIRNVATERPAS